VCITVSDTMFYILKGRYLSMYSSVQYKESITGSSMISFWSFLMSSRVISRIECTFENSSVCFLTRVRVVPLSTVTLLSWERTSSSLILNVVL